MIDKYLEAIRLGNREELFEIAHYLSLNPSSADIRSLLPLLVDSRENFILVACLALSKICDESSIPYIVTAINYHQNNQSYLDMLFYSLAAHNCVDYFIEIFNLALSENKFVSLEACEILLSQSFCLSDAIFDKVTEILKTANEIKKIETTLYSHLLKYINDRHINEDLKFVLALPHPAISKQDFIAFFSHRLNYNVEDNFATYENEDTDVEFCFEYLSGNDDLDVNVKKRENIILITICYCRPHVFALEASMEIENLIYHFQFKRTSAHLAGFEGNVYKIFIKKKFINSWNKGNKIAIENLVSEDDFKKNNFFEMKTLDIEKYWNWNFERKNRYDLIPSRVAISRFWFIVIEKKLYTAVVWSDGSPILLPKADFVILKRNKIDFENPEKSTYEKWRSLVPFSIVETILKNFSISTEFGFDAYKLFYEKCPEFVSDFFKKLTPCGNFYPVAMCCILNEVDKMRG